MVGRGDHHRVQLFAQRVEKLAVIGKGLDRAGVRGRQRFASLLQGEGDARGIRVRQRYNPFLAALGKQLPRAPP